VSILVGTVHFLERIHGDACRPLILVTTTNTLSAKLQSFWSALVPGQLTLILSSSKSARSWQAMLGSEQEAVGVSTWAVTRSHTKEVVADYAMVRGLDNCLRIVWTETETTRRADEEATRA
jgi:tRNA A37 threonylcarbamoyladenosine synthetase subunit TsaC/SUA5/YrdC